MIATHFPKSVGDTIIRTFCGREGRTIAPALVVDANGARFLVTLNRCKVDCVRCRPRCRGKHYSKRRRAS